MHTQWYLNYNVRFGYDNVRLVMMRSLMSFPVPRTTTYRGVWLLIMSPLWSHSAVHRLINDRFTCNLIKQDDCITSISVRIPTMRLVMPPEPVNIWICMVLRVLVPA